MLALIHRKKADAGFTLIELMVTLSIAAILMMVAAPNMSAFKRNSELSSLSNTMLSAINAARGEAMKRGMSAYIIPADGGNDWSVGWVVFVDKNRNQVYDGESTDQLVFKQAAPAAYFKFSGNRSIGESPAYIRFDASGYPKAKDGGSGNATFTIERNDLTSSMLYENTRRVKIDIVGRVRICKPASASDASCSPSP